MRRVLAISQAGNNPFLNIKLLNFPWLKNQHISRKKRIMVENPKHNKEEKLGNKITIHDFPQIEPISDLALVGFSIFYSNFPTNPPHSLYILLFILMERSYESTFPPVLQYFQTF